MSKKDKYKNYSKEKLISKIVKLEKTSYGLVWEDKPEEIADKCENELPVLTEDKSKEIKINDKEPTHLIIEGDNYHSLHALNFTHKKKIDVIYIDPPYNTGNKSWRYNNNYVDKEDRFRHSKWLSFMNKRLKLAKRLLTDDGILICTIDDYEFAPLKLIIDKIFGEQNRLGTVIVVNKAEGRTDDKFIATSHEYMLFYGKNNSYSVINGFNLSDDEEYDKYPEEDEISNYRLKPLRRGGTNSRRIDRPNLFYSIFFNEKTNKISLEKQDGFIEIKPIDSKDVERVWQWGKRKFIENHLTEIVIKKTKRNKFEYQVYRKVRFNKTKKVTTVWNSPKYNAAAHGTKVLEKILNKNRLFEYPKSLYAVIDTIFITSKKKDSIILDFFAGSGTTGHAVLKLNKQDKGNRQFILCTNNENKICEEVTYPRIKKVIEGYADEEGIPANVKYFKTDFVPKVLTDNDKRTLVSKSTELLCIAENTFEIVQERKRSDFSIFKNSQKLIVIIYDEDCIRSCCEEINRINPTSELIIYVFSYDHTYEEEDFVSINLDFKVKPIPEAILNVYRKLSKLRKR